MTKIKRFEDLNEAFNPQKTEVEGQKYNWMSFRLGDVLSDVKLINLNIDDLDDGEDLMLKYYEYPEDGPQVFKDKAVNVNGDNYKLVYLSGKYELGYLIFKNDIPVYIVGIYEPGNYKISERGLLSISGHEEVVNLWLDDGYYEMFHTR